MTGCELAATCVLFNTLVDYHCVMQMRKRGVFRRISGEQ